MQKKMLQMLSLTLLLGFTLTGCQMEIPLAEQNSLKLLVESATQVKALPPGQAKKVTPTVVQEKDGTTIIVGGLIHPKGRKPQLVTADGQYYELVNNRTSYDIWAVQKQVPYLMVKLFITGKKEGKIQYAELREVMTEGIVLPGNLGKHKGQYKFKHKTKGRKEKEYTIVKNNTGQDLEKYVGENSYYFFKIVGEVDGVVQISLYAIY